VTPPSRDRAREIESWFQDHEDGEFVVPLPNHRSSVVGDSSAVRAVIYTTKMHCLHHRLHALNISPPVMIVGRYGLPISPDLPHLDTLPVGTRCYFLGDADPPDILAFAWLREHAAICWLGVNDRLLNLGQAPYLARLEIAMSEAEKETMRMLPDLCPDFRDLLGPYCSRTLERGFKIELEAAMINLGSRPAD
jgi:hypothetical protein